MLDWAKYKLSALPDGKHNIQAPEAKFPGYIVLDKMHPFTMCNCLTYEINGVLSNEWAYADGPKEFEENLKKMPKDWKYRTKSITYTVNSSGYRTHEWKDVDWKNAIVMLGCSNTFGIGLAEDETIAYLLEKETGRQVVNLGYPSGSPDIVLNNCSSLIEKFGFPYAVVINWPPIDRLRFYAHDRYYDVGAWTPKNEHSEGADLNSLWTNTFVNETNTLGRGYYIAKATRSMFAERSKYISFSYFNFSAHYTRSDAYFHLQPTARDLLHPGYESSLEVIEYLKTKL